MFASKITLDKGINVTPDIIADILKRKYPECTVNIQTWGIGAPFIILRKNFFVRVVATIKRKKTGETEIKAQFGMDPLAWGLGFTFIIHLATRGDLQDEVIDTLERGLRNGSASDATIYAKSNDDTLFAESSYANDATRKNVMHNATVDNNPPVRKKKWGCFAILGVVVALLLFVCIRFCYFKIRYSNDGYAIFQDSTLTLYYGKNKPQGALSIFNTDFDNAMHYVFDFKCYSRPKWRYCSSEIKKVVFDSSFKCCYPVDCTSWFNGCYKLVEIIGMKEYFNTDNVTNMAFMFAACSSLTSLDLSNFKTDNVTNMVSMFEYCSLTSLDLSNFKTDNVTKMEGMFDNCSSLTTLDLSNFKTDNVTDMDFMFYHCYNLKTIYVGDGWNTNKVEEEYPSTMFSQCKNLVGGEGTEWNRGKDDVSFARIDGGPSAPGYFTKKK